MKKRLFVSMQAFLMVVLGASFALAAPNLKDRKEAKKLATQAKKLVKKGKHKKAVKKLSKADELVPAPSYKLQLAKALLELGDLVEAGAVLDACTETVPRQWVEKKAYKGCQKLGEEVEERVPTLEISIFEPSADEVTVTVAGDDFDPAEGAVEFNPGSYKIVATADGYADFSEKLTLDEGDVATVEITMKDASGASAADVDEADDDDGGGMSPIPAYIAWGVGAAGLGVGIGFGIAAIKSTNDVLTLYGCENGECPPEAESDLATAKTNGNVSTVGFIIGFTGVAAGTVLYLLSGDDSEDVDDDDDEGMLRLEAKPIITPGFIGLTGTF